jgi:hypothetical protein
LSSLCEKIVLEENNLTVFPNPFKDQTTVRIKFYSSNPLCPSFLSNQKLSLGLFDVLGRMIIYGDISNDINYFEDRIEIQIERNFLASGLYLWELKDENNRRIAVGKIIAQ